MTEVRSATDHCHPSDEVKISVTKVRSEMKEVAKTAKSRPMQILSQALLNSTEEVRARIGNLETIRRDIRKQKRGALPKDPATLSDFIVEEEWATTGGENPQPFLIHDSGPDVRNRVTIVASQPALQLLSQVDTWYMDGTFSIAPNIYTQVYVIRAPLGGTAVSCVYALMSGKHQTSYEEMLQAVIRKCEEHGYYPDPTTIVTNFEKASMGAVSTSIGDQVSIQGCFYHLTQSTWQDIHPTAYVEAVPHSVTTPRYPSATSNVMASGGRMRLTTTWPASLSVHHRWLITS